MNATAEFHVGDGALLAFIDGDIDRANRNHLVNCAACARRLDQLERAVGHVRFELTSVGVPNMNAAAMRARLLEAEASVRSRSMPLRWSWTSLALRAAGILILITGIAWATPARHWLVERFGRTDSSKPKSVATKSVVSPPEHSGAGMVVRFPAEASELVVRFAVRPSRGALELRATNDARVSAQISARAGGEEMLVLPGELRIVNSAASVADYLVTVPAHVAVVRVVIGDRPPRVVRLVSNSSEVVELSGGSR